MSLLSAVIQEANKTSSEDVMNARNDLLPKISDLSERLQIFSWGLQNYFVDVYLTSDTSRSLEHMNYKNRKYRAVTDLDDIQEEIEAFRKKFGENDDEFNASCLKLKEVVDNFNVSCTLVDGSYTLEIADREFRSLKYVDAVLKLRKLVRDLDEIKFEGNMATALRNFRGITETQLALSQAHLSLDWSRLFTWTFRSGVDTLTYSLSVLQSDPVLLQKVLLALHVSDQVNIDLNPFSDFFINKILPRVISHSCEIFTEDNIGALVFNIKIDLNDTKKPSIQTIFNNLMAVFDFLESTIGSKLDADKRFMEYFGECNKNAFFNKIIKDCIKNNLPSCESSYEAYKEIVLELEAFNKFLVELKYVEAEESPLNKYINHTDLLLYDRKCDKLLAYVRELMKECLPHGTETVGSALDTDDDSVLDITLKKFVYDLNTPIFFPKCVISSSAKKIATLLSTHLEETAKLPEEYGKQLALYIKDVAVMYQHLAPGQYRSNLNQNALEIALYFNNCHYLAHTLVGPPWKNVLPQPLADLLNTTLMPHIYDLRVVGMQRLSIFLRNKRELIFAKIEQSAHPWTSNTYESFNQNVNFVIEDLNHLKESWREVLPVRMYERAMCSLVSVLCDTMTKHVMFLSPIAEDVVHMLALRFEHAIEEIMTLFPDPKKLETRIKEWTRFTQMPKLLKAHLLEIASLWKDKSTITHTFTCEEIRIIVKMRFPDNKYRLKILMEIQ